MPVMPELRTQAKTNLRVAAAEMHGAVAKNVPVRYLEPDECTKVYAEKQIVLNLDLHKRLCAVVESWEDEEACKPLVAGAPLQETKLFGGKEQYFLRGFELAGLACRSSAPAIFHSIEPYLDWILYNMMRYNVVEETDVPDAEITPPTLESEWNKLQQQPVSDNLQLFNLDTCGLFSLESNSQTGKEATFAPWIVSFEKVHKRTANVNEIISSTAVLISEWYALAAKTSVQKNVVSRYLILGVGSHFDTFFADIKNIILPPPDHPRQLFALIELLEPADLTIPHIKPICLPFLSGLHRNKPAEVILSTRLINSFKKLKLTDYQRCLRRLLYIDQPITFDTEPSCAVEDLENFYQPSLASETGSPFQAAVWYEERPRYFLYGMHVNESSIFSTLHHGPYLFHKIEQADVAWIMENVRNNERQSSFPSKVRNERVNFNPVQRNASRRALLKVNESCGVSTNRYPTPWIVALVNKPSFSFPLGYVTLISDRFVVGPVYGCDGDSSAVCTLFVRFDGLPEPFIAIDKVFVHPRYDAANHANDIALARLVAAVDTSLPNVQPICLPIGNTTRSYDLSSLSMDYYDSSLWGYSVVNAGDRYIDHTDCQQRWEGLKVQLTVDRTNHCVTRKRTIEEDALIDIRIGFALHSRQSIALSEREYLRGFAVFKAIHAKSYYPDVYINTDAYLDWILDTMEQRPALPFDLREKLIFSDK
ncbi:uncharacterized protein LOC121597044 isoform X2 [Anopheles merus]|uniref:uncharacterized protein LOC121597044 isoform X2 n=1 Tax=Anopheles merus TaxID=30066 RepID=UPI001BE46C06|nr:uncharacterized protein LOC121597044 isoform X2 [Anopheles merus]